jgi:microcystin-dependent protein
MPHIVEDRILESTTTTGTGDITLAAAITGFRRVSALCAVGDTLPYFIEAIDATGLPTGDYEYGIGTYSAANTLTRTKVEGSSNAGALVNFTTGSKNVGMPALAGAHVPTGARMEFLGSVVPGGYLELNGSLKSRVAYPALYAYALASGIMAASDAAWATDKGKFSPGDGATTFRIPDHRGYHTRAWDHGAGVDAGRDLATTQADQLLAHSHGVTDPAHAHSGAEFGGVNTFAPGGSGGNFRLSGAGGTYNTGASATGISINSTGGTEARVKNIATLVCVKY